LQSGDQAKVKMQVVEGDLKRMRRPYRDLRSLAGLVFILLLGCAAAPKAPPQGLPSPLANVSEPGLETRALFDDFLEQLKRLLLKSRDASKPYPKVFLSYAWEDEHSSLGLSENRALQRRLMVLQEDLESIGIETFIDLKYMQGNIRKTMKKNLEAADFVMVIGTPRLKERSRQDKLFLAPYFDPESIPKMGNAVLLVEGRDCYAVYYLEKAQLKEIITVPIGHLAERLDLPWIQKAHALKEGALSEKTNEILEYCFARLKHRGYKFVSNVQFELGIALDKAESDQKALIPLIVKGEHSQSFPGAMHNILIRALGEGDPYYQQLSSLSNPLGIIPTLFPELLRNPDYENLVKAFKKASA
jgi:hypothetical protein